MASIHLTRSPDYMVSEVGLYLESQLGVETVHAELHTEWTAEQVELSGVNVEYAAAKRDVVIARAHRDRQQQKVRIGARSFANELIDLNGGNRKSDAYLAYFENGYGVFARLRLPAQLERARAILIRLDSEPDERVRTAGEAFREAVAVAETALRDYDSKVQAVVDIRSRLHGAKIRWRRAYRKVEAELRSLHSDDPRYVSSFFLARPPRRQNGVVDEGEAILPTEDDGAVASDVNATSGAGSTNGTNGTNGVNGANGASGTNGANGVNAETGAGDGSGASSGMNPVL
jgi:hypothetical protein